MTPEKRRDFERQWPTLARRVEGMLIRKGVPACRRDDIMQETALRLIRVWDDVDPLKSVPALAATIALNLVRDESRRRTAHDDLNELSEVSEPGYVEAAGLARVELSRVRSAMAELSPAQRDALLAEIGDGNPSRIHHPNAEKMLRLRARKKLMAAMEKVSGALLLRLRRAGDVLQLSSSGLREAFVQGVSCLGCVAVGLMVGLDARLSSPDQASSAPNIDGAKGSIARTVDADATKMAAVRHAADHSAPKGTVENRVVKSQPNADVKGRPKGGRSPSSTSSKAETPEEPTGTLPVEVPDTGVTPPDKLPEAPAPEVPQPEVPAPAPAPAPPLPENHQVGKIVGQTGLNATSPSGA